MASIEERWRPRLTVMVACAISTIWIVAMARDLYDPDYDVPNGVTILMTSVAGWLFAGGAAKKVKDFLANEETDK